MSDQIIEGHSIVYRAHRYECELCGARRMSVMQFQGRECPGPKPEPPPAPPAGTGERLPAKVAALVNCQRCNDEAMGLGSSAVCTCAPASCALVGCPAGTGERLTDADAVAKALTSPLLAEKVLAAADAALPHWRANAVTNAVASFVNEAVRVVVTDRSGRPSNERDGACICNYNPETTDGPDEECPFHGRPYAYWIERGDALAARLDAGLALTDECAKVMGLPTPEKWDQGWRAAHFKMHDRLRAALSERATTDGDG